MFKLLAISAIAMLGARMSAANENRDLLHREYYRKIRKDSGFLIVIIALALFAGLRTSYNDTWAYWRTFASETATPMEYIKNDWHWLKNPGMELYKAVIRQFSTDKTPLFLPAALFVQYSLIRFFKLYAVEFDFSVYLYLTMGMFCFTMGAMKQGVAIAFLTYAVEAAGKRKWLRFALFVFIAFLFHTYAIVLIVVPFLRRKPWSAFTWIMTIALVFVYMNLEPILGSVIDMAGDAGKKIYQDEILGGVGSNIFRIMVYAVPVVMSFVFRRKLFEDSSPEENILMHLSILSFACMAYGLTVSANEADRLATYFEMGTVVILPWIIKKAFRRDSQRMVRTCAYVAFFIYFVYKFGVVEGFDHQYTSIFSR